MKTIQFLLSCAMLIIQLSLSAQPIHAYELNSSYADTYGGSGMVPNGGVLTTTSYIFGLGQGPSVINATNPNTYTIVMRFIPGHVDYWAKVLDFKNKVSDNGAYITDNRFMFYIGSPFLTVYSDAVISQHVPAVICLSRDGANKEVRGYVNGDLLWSFTDNTDEATFTGPGNIIQIGVDDYESQNIPDHDPEEADGALDYFRVYDYVVTDPAIINPPCGGADADCDGISNSCDVCPGGNDNGPCIAKSLPPLNTLPADWQCSNNNNSEKILICHEGTTLCVSENAAGTHLAHGDFLGPCTSCPQNFSTPGSSNNFVTATGLESLHPVSQEEPDITRGRMKLNQFQIFPNPASAEIHFVLPEVCQKGTLRIFSLTGQEMHILPLSNQGSIALDLSAFAAGIYLIDVGTSSGHYWKKFVKL